MTKPEVYLYRGIEGWVIEVLTVLLAREVLLSHYSQVRWYYLVGRENISIKPIEQSNQT